MRKYEQEFCTKLQKWLLYNGKESCIIEAKVSIDDKPFNFKSGFKPHQIPTLLQIKNGTFAYKVSDLDQLQKPFDVIFTKKMETYIAIHWVRRGNKTFYLIEPSGIDALISMGKKSLYENEAKDLASIIGELK
jgi:hypothetical protein